MSATEPIALEAQLGGVYGLNVPYYWLGDAIRYHPLFLNNHLPEETPVSKEEYFSKKFPTPEDGAKIIAMLTKRGKEEGLAL